MVFDAPDSKVRWDFWPRVLVNFPLFFFWLPSLFFLSMFCFKGISVFFFLMFVFILFFFGCLFLAGFT